MTLNTPLLNLVHSYRSLVKLVHFLYATSEGDVCFFVPRTEEETFLLTV